jgi:putative N6-adenine-specific DNA methylase
VPRFFATCARGLEPALSGELLRLGAADVTPGRGGVTFAGGNELLYKANLWLRTAVRVLRPVVEGDVFNPDQLYELVRSVDWAEYMTPDHTLAVDCNVRDSNITHSQYAARRVKDGICDQFRDKTGVRPSVDVEYPMVGLNLHVARNHAVLSLDSAWHSLHKRGYRPIQTRAPLNEALAAGLLMQTGWTGDTPLVDPMCGSGTFIIEGAWLAGNRAPGLTRKWFGFLGWPDFDRPLWNAIREEARRQAKPINVPLVGSDLRADAIAFARDNATAAGVGGKVTFTKQDVVDARPPAGGPGVMIVNPPYGERIGEEREWFGLYRALGETVAAHWPGWRLFVFTSNDRLRREIRLKVVRMVPFFNGTLDCRLPVDRVRGGVTGFR